MKHCSCRPPILKHPEQNLEEETKKRLLIFRMVAKDLAEVNDEIVETMMEIYAPHLSKKVFGKLYDQALVYYVAHHMVMHETIANSGSTSGSSVAGQITSEREGDLSRSYGSGGGGTSASSGYDGSLGKTAYGIEFMRLRSMVSVGVMTRFG